MWSYWTKSSGDELSITLRLNKRGILYLFGKYLKNFVFVQGQLREGIHSCEPENNVKWHG